MVKVRVREKALLQILAERNMSQNGLARSAGLTSGHVSQLIRGTRYVAPRTRQRIIQALGDVPFDRIFSIHIKRH